jgi:hypothetical protein
MRFAEIVGDLVWKRIYRLLSGGCLDDDAPRRMSEIGQ